MHPGFLVGIKGIRRSKEMCVRKVNAGTRIQRICAQNRFSQGIVLEKAKKILDQYRDGKYMARYSVGNEDEKLERVRRLIREKYHQTYVMKEGHKTGSIDYLVMEVIGTSWADVLVEKTYNLVSELGLYEDDYKTILDMYYLDKNVHDDDYIMDSLGLARTTYYRRKKEAITVFGIALWLTMVSECIANVKVV